MNLKDRNNPKIDLKEPIWNLNNLNSSKKSKGGHMSPKGSK